MIIINEFGLYNVIMQSRKPEAKIFKRWVTHEVLPSIRKKQVYISPARKQFRRQINRLTKGLEGNIFSEDASVVDSAVAKFIHEVMELAVVD